MKYLLILCFIIGVASNCRINFQNREFNLDFERVRNNASLPEGWRKEGVCKVIMEKRDKYEGKYAIKIFSDGIGCQPGGFIQKISAQYEGSSIRLEGFMKTKNVEDGFAALSLRIDDENGFPLEMNFMESENIHGSNEWKKYSIELPFPPEAEDIYIGGILLGKGEVLFDDFSLSIDGKDIQSIEKTDKIEKVYPADLDNEFSHGSNITLSNLSDQDIVKLDLLGRVWGFLKYYHPAIAEGKYNWDNELFRFLPDYLAVNSGVERDRLLVEWIHGLGDVFPCENCPSATEGAVLVPDLDWVHDQQESLKETLLHIYHNRNQQKHYYIQAVPNNDNPLCNGNPIFSNEREYAGATYPDDGIRLLCLYRYWNIIQYFFPYKHLIDRNWNEVLTEYIPELIEADNGLEYQLVVLKLIGEIQDSHAFLQGDYRIQKLRGN